MSVQKTAVTIAKCKGSLLFFTRWFFKKQTGRRFIINHHHEKIIQALERVMSGECRRLIINIAPRYSKTELAVKSFIAHSLAINPSARFIHLSYSDSLALDNSESIKDLIQSDEYSNLFPDVVIKKDSKAKNKWYTTLGGGVLARSASGQVTGFGAGQVDDEIDEFLNQKEYFGGAIIIDDPIKPEDADSSIKRERVNKQFDSTVRSRVNSRNTPIIVIMQRVHMEDLTGYLINVEPDEWEVLSLPAIQSDGTALWPHKHTIDELIKLKKVNELVFDRQYQQNPQPSAGVLFPKESLNFYNGHDFDPKEIDAISGFIDTADTGEDSLCMPIGYNIGEKIFIHDVVFTKEGTDITPRLCAETINKHSPHVVRIESNMGGSMFRGLLKPFVKQSTQLLTIRAKANKHIRITTLAGFIKEFCYFRDNYDIGSDYHKFMTELMSYMKDGSSKHDDAADGVTGLCSLIRRQYPQLYPAYQLEDGYSLTEK
jgi:predicted phage terminase large subunit-like protein